MTDIEATIRMMLVEVEEQIENNVGWDAPPAILEVTATGVEPVAVGDHPIVMMLRLIAHDWRPVAFVVVGEGTAVTDDGVTEMRVVQYYDPVHAMALIRLRGEEPEWPLEMGGYVHDWAMAVFAC